MERRGGAEMWERCVSALRKTSLQDKRGDTSSKTGYCLNKYITETSGRDITIWGVGTFLTCLLSECVQEYVLLCLLGLQRTHWSLT